MLSSRSPAACRGLNYSRGVACSSLKLWRPLAMSSRPRGALVVRAAAASALNGADLNPLNLSYSEALARRERSRLEKNPLPSPPTESSFQAVIPYLIKLALAEKQMYWRLGAAFLCLIASKAAGLMCPIFLKKAVDAFSVHAGEPPGVIMAAATTALLMYGTCDILKHMCKELQAPLFNPVSQAAARRVAYHTFSHVLGLDIRFHLDRRTGRLSRILERGTRSIQMLYRAIIFTFIPTFLELLFVCGVLAQAFSPLVGGLVIATFTVYVTWSVVLTQLAAEARKQVNVLDNATTSKAVDALLNFETVALFNNRGLEVGQYNEYLKGFMRATLETERLAATLNAGQAAILATGLTAIMVTAITTAKAASAGDLVMIQGLLLQLWAPLQFLGWFYRELRSALVDMDDFFSILRTTSSIKEGSKPVPQHHSPPALATTSSASATSSASSPSHAGAALNGNGHSDSSNGNSTNGVHHYVERELAQEGGGSRAHSSEGASSSGRSGPAGQGVTAGGLHIELRDVRFSYTPNRQILKGVSLTAEPGQSVAVVGSSGSGKSTILKLLTRLYDVCGGEVRLNGEDIRDLKLESLRQAVGVVPQDCVLFNDSVMQNIRYGRPEATDEEVLEAARMAHLHETVSRMPDGYNTMVGERGLKLSGGEKQRVAIARAFLRQPRLLICDEATSALDSETEAQIMASLAELAQGRTSVFVAHRLSTVRGCDKIVVLREGVVVEEGSHDELMAKGPGGVYREMWERQAAEEKLMHEGQQHMAAARGGSAAGLSMDEGEEGWAAGPLSLSDEKQLQAAGAAATGQQGGSRATVGATLQ